MSKASQLESKKPDSVGTSTHPPSVSRTSQSQSGSERGWSRNNELGAASRGAAKGRQGNRGGRGGRSRGGGGSKGVATPSCVYDGDHPITKDQANNKPLPGAPAIIVPTTSTVTKPSSRPKPAKKGPDGKASRKATGSVPATPLMPHHPMFSSAPARPSNRRKRSHSKGSVTAPSKSSVSSESSLSRSERNSSISKDLPPHLSSSADHPSFDIRHDIEALVERVRAVAMDRPHTPGSHFDWATDDDDSLPDLPDWGVSVAQAGQLGDTGKASVISPILEDALKPLPSLDPGTPIAAMSDNCVERITVDSPTVAQDRISEHSEVVCHDTPIAGEQDTSLSDAEQLGSNHNISTTKCEVVAESMPSSSSHLSPQVIGTQPSLHPSLPPKPVTTMDSASSRRHPATVHKASSAEPVLDGLAQSMHAPTPKSARMDGTVGDQSPDRGLAASIHAPIPSSRSAPSHLSTHPFVDMPHQAAYNRSRTLGRGHRQPHSASVSHFSDHQSDLDRNGRNNAHHARTHSTPPPGSGTSAAHGRSRSNYATRPVITGDAISRLARTLGGSAPKRDNSIIAMSVAKD
ncbi:uncharacterized protein FIBRA_07004 [Fibroporia radiculosa]|uniref:Uncharacterized protein n=1 Tax=Fibroporia radiculosa TaxID=599839 RepID=J4IBK3_9APHY|nr:uncharacterized protein FIBRA_07004 [Fibroporia radiculosa]CCM04811.1 predicted protein [Fibroporia radiculosa]